MPKDITREFVIYALCEIDGRVRYIGATAQHPPQRRVNRHMRDVRLGSQYPVHRWIRRLVANGGLPLLTIIDRGVGEWAEREILWIAHFRSLYGDMLNLANGGQGGDATPTEARKRAAEKLKHRYFSPEHRARISAAKTGQPRTDAEAVRQRLKKVSEANRGKKMNLSDAERDRRRAMLTGGKIANEYWASVTPKQRFVHAEKSRKTMLAVWARRSPANRAEIMAKITKGMRNGSK